MVHWEEGRAEKKWDLIPEEGKRASRKCTRRSADMSYIQDVHGFIDKGYGDIILSSGYVARPGIT